MANVKTSDESAASTLTGTELLRAVQSGSNVQTTTGAVALSVSDADTALAANSDLKYATQKAVKAYIDSIVTGGASDVMIFKGVIDASANPNYPAADAGNLYKISVAGKIGGASGPNVEVGDTIYCLTDATASGTQAGVGANWVIVQVNVDGAVIGPASATDGHLAVFDGTTGKLVRDGGAPSAGGLTNFTESVNSSTPNATVPVVRLLATNAATNVDTALTAKGSGSLLAQIPDNTSAGGNKRGTGAVDWQMSRSGATGVAAGTQSVIGGGNGNIIGTAGAQSVIGGGNANTISGTAGSSTIAGGDTNVVSSNYGSIGGGFTNTVSTANYASVVGGANNIASATGASVLGGDTNIADGTYSLAMGRRASVRGMSGAFAHNSDLPSGATQGARQSRHATLQANSTSTTPVILTTNSSAAGTANQFVLPTGSALALQGQVVFRNTSGGDAGRFTVDGVWKNVSGTVTLSGTPIISTFMGDASLIGCTLTAQADNTNKAAQLSFVGLAATNITVVFEGWSAEAAN